MMLKPWVLILGLVIVLSGSSTFAESHELVENLTGQGRFVEALARFDELHAEADSMAAEIQIRHLDALKLKHDTAGLQSNVKDLNLEKRLQRTLIRKEASVRFYLLIGLGALAFGGLFLFWKYLNILKKSALSLKRAEELNSSRRQLTTLEGLLPVCGQCRQVRSDDGYWARVDEYLRVHSDVLVSHGICPDCALEHYSDLLSEDED